jgi:simple sugar transport system ATP-binding protein
VGYQAAQAGRTLLSVEHLSVTESTGVNSLSDISFSVFEGEILGIAGVSGNGQSELLEVLAGIKAITSGVVQIGDRKFTAEQPACPSEVKQLGLAHVPEDRHAMGLVLPFTAAESAVLGYEYADAMGGRSPVLSPVVMAAHCKMLMAAYDVRPADPSLKSNLFSGGNQQKIVLARELSSRPDILLVGQPTRGVDIGAIEFIHKQLLAMRDSGCAVILVSVELDEIMSLSDRIMVMNDGRNMGIVRQAGTDIQEIGLMMAGVTVAPPHKQKVK